MEVVIKRIVADVDGVHREFEVADYVKHPGEDSVCDCCEKKGLGKYSSNHLGCEFVDMCVELELNGNGQMYLKEIDLLGEIKERMDEVFES